MSIAPPGPALAPPNGQASPEAASVTLAQVKGDPEVHVLIRAANENLGVIGYTDHGLRHAEIVARDARVILRRTGFSRREQDLAAVSGYLHDIGNVVGRHSHAQSGALLAHSILTRLGATPQDTAIVMGAIGSHEDEGSMGDPVHAVSAALILADKADVHRSRVRDPDPLTLDIHDRVNYAATASHLNINSADKTITLDLQIDTRIAPVMTYFEIFLPRMLMSRRAAEMLGYAFRIKINGVPLL